MSGRTKVAAVVLAAGASRRLGRPKQAVVLGGETLVERAVRVAREAGLTDMGVVVNQGAPWIERLKATVLTNAASAEGMATSIGVGVRWAQSLGAEGVVLMTCDQVAVTAEHLRALYAQAGVMTGSGYAGKIGIPAYFPAAYFGALLMLEGDAGARQMLREARVVATEALAFDVDTEEDLARAQAMFEGC